jgi:N-acetylmuramoyl-L-alanine amidase
MIVPPTHPKTASLPYHWLAGAVKELARQAGDTDARHLLHRAVGSVKVSDPEGSLESGLARGGHHVTSASVRAVEGWWLRGLVALTLVLMCVASPLLSAQPSSPDPSGAKIPIIVLDPGHGGADVGSRGPTGLLEKDITLQVATEAARFIEQLLGLRAVLTRTDDSAVPLETRAALTNRSGGDLFISIHVAASFGPMRRDFQALYFEDVQGISLRTRDEPKPRARPDRGGQAQPGANLLAQAVVWEQAQLEFLETSQIFARLLYKNLRAQVAEEGHGIFGLPLLLLRWIRMPAVLLDLGSLSNPAFEDKLRDEAYLQRVALGIAQAVNDYYALQR